MNEDMRKKEELKDIYLEKNNELDPEKIKVLDAVAGFFKKRNISIIGTMLLESTRPLHYLGAQAMIFFEPFLNIIIKEEKLRLFRESMEDKRYVEYLLKKLED